MSAKKVQKQKVHETGNFFPGWVFKIKKQQSAHLYCLITGEIRASSRHCTHPAPTLVQIFNYLLSDGVRMLTSFLSVSHWLLGFVYFRAGRRVGGRREGGKRRSMSVRLLMFEELFFFFHMWPSFHLIFFVLLHNKPLVYEHLWALEGSKARVRRSRVSFG